MSDGEVVELLKIANGYLPRVRLEYDRLKDEKSSLEAELNSWKAELSNTARTYQQFVDRNIELKKREDELQLTIDDMENKKAELQKTTTELKQYILRIIIHYPEVKQMMVSLCQEKAVVKFSILRSYFMPISYCKIGITVFVSSPAAESLIRPIMRILFSHANLSKE